MYKSHLRKRGVSTVREKPVDSLPGYPICEGIEASMDRRRECCSYAIVETIFEVAEGDRGPGISHACASTERRRLRSTADPKEAFCHSRLAPRAADCQRSSSAQGLRHRID